ncbi:PP2C family protein-serine/threonine phosphatase [Piscinibacter koreensis]|uniref:Serine/threonine-protein phosphatase n=1 Tax=Piscinibacter koreensis TaxID=2742824 RepID=A0A7Y6NRI2_9BURK|nr:PP2C family serine/threonine-protein phosphatase [Schlegelella koreensis]NUZ07976.1 serine/threonine-protein phosphatase [Schlegelella koreensis]
MTTPHPSGGRLTTPIEPGPGGGLAALASHAVHASAFRRLEAAVVSTCGSQHAANEDAHSEPGGAGQLFVVADGVGGGAMAGTASRLLVAELHRALDAGSIDAGTVRDAVLAADHTIRDAIARVTPRPGAATLVLAAPLDAFGARWLVAWVGDCRAYRLAAAHPRLDLITRDETFRHLGEAPPAGGSPDDPARMVGNGATDGPSVATVDLDVGDVLLLCSDGVHKSVGAAAMVQLLSRPLPLARQGEALVALARRNGSVDDATALLVRRCGFGAAAPPGTPSHRFDGSPR